MKLIVLDTNILIDYVNGYAKWLGECLEARQSDIRLVIPTIVMSEYFTSSVFENEKEISVADKTFAVFQKQGFTEEIAKVLGTILRRKTYVSSAGLADLIIASTAIYLDAQLATRNKADFARIPTLRFFDPKSLSPKFL